MNHPSTDIDCLDKIVRSHQHTEVRDHGLVPGDTTMVCCYGQHSIKETNLALGSNKTDTLKTIGDFATDIDWIRPTDETCRVAIDQNFRACPQPFDYGPSNRVGRCYI